MTSFKTKHENGSLQNSHLRHVLNWYCYHINKSEGGQEGDPANITGCNQDDVDQHIHQANHGDPHCGQRQGLVASLQKYQKSFKLRKLFMVNHSIEFFLNAGAFQWIQRIQRIWQITEAWIGVNLKILTVTCVFVVLLIQEVVSSRLIFLIKIFCRFYRTHLGKTQFNLFLSFCF